MQFTSEYNTRPRLFLMHRPDHNVGLKQMAAADTSRHNFATVPNQEELTREYRAVVEAVTRLGGRVVDIADLMEGEDLRELEANPNSIFTRDPLITLPWEPQTAIVANMTLPGRESEPSLMIKAARQFGITRFMAVPPEIKLEGGDVLPEIQAGKRTLYVGVGSRSSTAAVQWLTRTLVREGLADEVIGIRHGRNLLHLDTCLAILPHRTLIWAEGALTEIVSTDFAATDPVSYFTALGYTILRVSSDLASRYEDCNLLPLGGANYLAFQMPARLASTIEADAGIHLEQIDGIEIAKANGGVHCLARPIY